MTASSCGRWLTARGDTVVPLGLQQEQPGAGSLHERDEIRMLLGQRLGPDVRGRGEDVGGVLEKKGVGVVDAAFLGACHWVPADKRIGRRQDAAGVLGHRRFYRADVRYHGAFLEVRRHHVHQAQDRAQRCRQNDKVGLLHGHDRVGGAGVEGAPAERPVQDVRLVVPRDLQVGPLLFPNQP